MSSSMKRLAKPKTSRWRFRCGSAIVRVIRGRQGAHLQYGRQRFHSRCRKGDRRLRRLIRPTVKLPNGDRADLGTKLSDYVLNPEHRHGRHKARVFVSSLGITRQNQQLLADALRKAATDSTDVISIGDQGFGEIFEIRFPLATDRGQATVLSAWIIRRGEDFPRLVTCFIV